MDETVNFIDYYYDLCMEINQVPSVENDSMTCTGVKDDTGGLIKSTNFYLRLNTDEHSEGDQAY